MAGQTPPTAAAARGSPQLPRAPVRSVGTAGARTDCRGLGFIFLPFLIPESCLPVFTLLSQQD